MGSSTVFFKIVIFLNIVLVLLSEDCSQFDEYVINFKKQYKNEEEKQFRRQVFCQNLKELQEMKKKVPTCQFKINHLSDRTKEQRKKNGLKTPSLTQRQESPQKNKLSFFYPDSLDWRDKNGVTEVKDQGQCGSCWTFAVAAYAQSKLIIQGRYDQFAIDLSEQYLLQCTRDSDCSGGYMQYVMETAESGVPTQEKYPYRPFIPYSSSICKEDEKIRFGSKSLNYLQLSDTELIILLQTGPVAISISSEGWSYYQSGIYECSPNPPIDHAVLLVGYTPQYWIIKNQWGSSWGEKGYMRITRDTSKNCHLGYTSHVMFQFRFYFSIILLSLVLMILS